jgi:glycosyltransferase involved in cell wall biosynthesis
VDISIIIPTYNRLWSLPKAVSSCFDPALNIEIIVIDDGSTDGTWNWLMKQDNIIAISQDNMGKDWAVNKGFGIARGKYIRFLDSDDWILPDSSARLFQKAEKTGADLVCAGYETYDENEKLTKETSWTVCDDFVAQQLGECDASHYSAYLFKKEFINNIPHRQEFGGLDDRQFIIEAALKHPKTSYILSPALAHRIHNNIRLQNISGIQKAAYHLAYYNIYNKALHLLQARGELNQRRKNAVCNNLWHLAHWTAYTDIAFAYKIHKWVYELNPQFKPTGNKALALLYKNLGFTFTERLLKLKRG